MVPSLRLKVLLVCLVAVFSLKVQSEDIFINVGQANVKKSLLALPPLLYTGTNPGNKAHIQAGQDLFKIISNDLMVSGFFNFIKPEAFLEDPAKVGLKPAPGTPNGFKFESWKTIGADFLVRGGYRVNGSNLSLEIYVYHVPQAKQIVGKTYEGNLSTVRQMAHTFSNDIVKALTGKPASFLTKAVASVQTVGSKHKEIYTMDWDGANLRPITSHKSIAISPAWSPDGKKIAYTAFAYHTKAKTRNADLFVYDLTTDKRFLTSYRKGINSGAAFTPDGQHILLTISQGGSPDIFRMTFDGKSLQRLTRG
ncbi:MAG: PD40 domain-containing protein, partial [Bdellovibrionales bacterium]|nr:PD40 domain-containing protein [Bdellovibrionales bacterium]